MPVFFIVVGVVTLAFLVAMLVGWFDTAPAPDPVRPFGHVPLPESGHAAADVDDVRFDAVFRGYKMSEVDGVLERMQHRQAELEEQVRTLGGDPEASVGGAGAVPAEVVVASGEAARADVTAGATRVTAADDDEPGSRTEGDPVEAPLSRREARRSRASTADGE